MTVTARPAAIALTLGAASLVIGQQTQATAVVRDAAGATLTGVTVTFASSNASVASITQAGLITANSPGSVTLSASVDALLQTAALAVTAPIQPVASIQPFTIPSTVGGTTRVLAAVPLDASGAVLTNRVCTWASSAPQAGAVTSPGMTSTLAVPAALASTTPVSITVTCETKSAVATFSATPIPVASITLSRDSAYLAHGESGMIRAIFRDAQNNVLTGRSAVFYDNSAGYLSLPPTGSWTPCANEGAVCAVSGLSVVRFGVNGNYVYRSATSAVNCAVSAFVQDPMPGTQKQCATSTPTTTTSGEVLATAAYCYADGCARGVATAQVLVVPVENPQNVTAIIAQSVVPAFILTARTPTSNGPLSVETTNTLTFSNSVTAAGLGANHLGLRETGSSTTIAPEGGLSVVGNIISFPAVLSENKSYEFFYTSVLRDVYGKALKNPGAFSYTTVQMDKLYYYRLTSVYANAAGRSLAINAATLQCTMALTNISDPQQRWFAEPYDAAQPGLDTRFSTVGRVRLRTQSYGSTKNLEGATPGGPCQMNPASNVVFSGEAWYIAQYFGDAFWLHTGDPALDFALDQPGGAFFAGLAARGAFTGQFWSFTRLGRR